MKERETRACYAGFRPLFKPRAKLCASFFPSLPP